MGNNMTIEYVRNVLLQDKKCTGKVSEFYYVTYGKSEVVFTIIVEWEMVNADMSGAIEADKDGESIPADLPVQQKQLL